jgi:hypothetical protein
MDGDSSASSHPPRSHAWVWLGLVVAVNLVVGFVIASRHGLSFDEPGTIIQGTRTLQAYARLTPPTDSYKDLEYYGPFYFALAEIGARLLVHLRGAWTLIDARHFFYFVTFQGAFVAVYLLSSRLVRRGAAFAAALLFVTQPLLFGHAFINPKDAPFMAFFLFAMVAGLGLADRLGDSGLGFESPQAPESRKWGSAFRSLGRDFMAHGPTRLIVLCVLVVAGILVILDLYVFQRVLLPTAQALVRSAYLSNGHGLLGWLFSHVAEKAGSVPLESYLEKTRSFIQERRGILAILAVVPAMAVGALVVRPALKKVRPRGVVGLLITASVFLGLATSIRVAGPFAGVLVSLLVFVRARRRALLPLAGYWVLAAAVCYLTWPFLWGAPVARFAQAWSLMSDFPWDHQVLYQGGIFLAGELPWHFKVVFPSIQLTEPLLALAFIGVAVAVFRLKSRTIEAWLLLILGLWWLFPVVSAVVTGATAYDNSRQFLFTLPPLFVFAAVALDLVFQTLRRDRWRLAIAALAVVPGAASIVSLSPYEYVYFNSIAGGVHGAYRYYELDYWATAYRDAMGYVDAHAKPNAVIAVADPWRVGWAYARPDFKRWGSSPAIDAGRVGPDYAVLTTRSNVDLDTFPQAKVVYKVEAGGAVLAVVKQVAPPAGGP